MRIVIICMLGLLLVGCGGAAVDLPTDTPPPPAAPTDTLPPPTAVPPTAVPSPTAVPVADLIAQGDALVEQGRLEEAIRVYRRAVSLEPDNARAHNALGIAYGLSGEFEQAEFELGEALRIEPENGVGHSNLCKVYYDQNKIEQALAECLEGIRLSPDVSQSHTNLGMVYSDQGNLDQALAEHLEAARLDPTLATPHSNVGVIYERMGRLEDAVAAYQQAVRLDPEYVLAHYNLGNAYNALGQTEQAIAEWQTAVEINPEFASAHLNLGVVYKLLGRNEQAIVEFETYLELVPDSPQREAVESDLAALKTPQPALPAEYVDPFGGYRVSHPADWTAHPQNEPGTALLGANVADPDPFVAILARALSLFAIQLDVPEIATASEFASALAPRYGLDPQTLEADTVAGVPALSGAWNGADNSGQTVGRVSFFVDRGMGYLFTSHATPGQADAFAPTAQAMLDSFTFVEPAVTVAYASPTAGYQLLYPEGWVVADEETSAKFTPGQELEPNDAPYVATIAGQDQIATTFQVTGDLTTASIVDSLVRLTQAEAGEPEDLELAGEKVTGIELHMEVDGEPVHGVAIVFDPATRPLIVLGLAPASQWATFSQTFITMMGSLAFSAAAAQPGTVDFTDPAAVVQAVFDAAATQDFSALASLCDPLGENDEDTAMICAITDSHANRDAFIEYFAQGKLVNEGEIHAGRYEVPFLFGPDGDQEELMILIQRDGKWYLFSF